MCSQALPPTQSRRNTVILLSELAGGDYLVLAARLLNTAWNFWVLGILYLEPTAAVLMPLQLENEDKGDARGYKFVYNLRRPAPKVSLPRLSKISTAEPQMYCCGR